MANMDDIFVQVRSRLHDQNIRLWEEPYYSEGVGSIESEMDSLADEYSQTLGINVSRCRCALTELQDHALRKLAARREFNETGLATFKVRCIDNHGSTTKIIEVKCNLSEHGSTLQSIIASNLKLSNASHVKCIAAGRIVMSNATLDAQGIKNNQQLIVIVGRDDNQSGILHERINKIREDVASIVASQRHLVEVEDQDGNTVFLPPEENRAVLMGMGLCEKARAAMHRESYDEALLLLLEADEQFASCNSEFLESVDNYALLNLDIVWCYLCLKNVSQLPDAERRLQVCERSFRRSYGENYARLYALKGRACAERALILRLNLLQGVVLFHQNRRDEAYDRFETAGTALQELKVNDEHLSLLVEMGFDLSEARLALRSCSGDVQRAVQFIQDRKNKLRESRKESGIERELSRRYASRSTKDHDWVNPRSVCTLSEMGFDRRLVVAALRRTKNDLQLAIDLLQTNGNELQTSISDPQIANTAHLNVLEQLGFDVNSSRAALETTHNDLERAIEYLLRDFESEDELISTIDRLSKLASNSGINEQPGTSNDVSAPGLSTFVETALRKAQIEIDAYKAYKRFHSDLTHSEQDYLDLPLVQEEQLLAEYRNLLER